MGGASPRPCLRSSSAAPEVARAALRNPYVELEAALFLLPRRVTMTTGFFLDIGPSLPALPEARRRWPEFNPIRAQHQRPLRIVYGDSRKKGALRERLVREPPRPL